MIKKNAGDLQSPGQSGGFEPYLAKSAANSIRFKSFGSDPISEFAR